jgi:hypothetical protein
MEDASLEDPSFRRADISQTQVQLRARDAESRRGLRFALTGMVQDATESIARTNAPLDLDTTLI